MKKLQTKLEFLLDKYSINKKVTLLDENTVVVDGIKLPLLAHRTERRFIELKNMAKNGTLVGISTVRVARIVGKSCDVYETLYRELDLCEYILQKKIKSICVMENGSVLNAIATTQNGIVCTLEIAATLKKGELQKDKHEIISQRGIACDVVVDAQLKQDSIYVFGKENEKFTDMDFELYGLDPNEIAIVRAAFSLSQCQNTDELKETEAHLCSLIDAAKKSAVNGRREAV